MDCVLTDTQHMRDRPLTRYWLGHQMQLGSQKTYFELDKSGKNWIAVKNMYNEINAILGP